MAIPPFGAPPPNIAAIRNKTRNQIIVLTPSKPTVAIASDTNELFIWDGTNWKVASVKMSTELSGQDMGYTQDNDKQGYGEDYIDGKKATTFGIGQFVGTPYNGALRLDQSVTPMKMQIFARGIWNQIFYDLQMVNGDFEHIPVAYTIDVRSGNSNQVGLNGLPIVREYKVDMGAYPTRIIIDGGTL